jgi:hypothetical protein
MAPRHDGIDGRLTARMLHLTRRKPCTAAEICRILGATGEMAGYITDLIVRLANTGKLMRSWDKEGMCYYTAAADAA